MLGAGLAFGAACATLALMGLGVPMLLAALGSAAAAGLVLHAALLAQAARPAAALPRLAVAAHGGPEAGYAAGAAEPAADLRLATVEARLADVETRAATLRHDLRGVLSPALMVTDRLLRNPDPAIQRAGQAIVRSVDRATEIIQASKPEPPAAGAPGARAPGPPAAPAAPAAG